jgi:hypothetical protein
MNVNEYLISFFSELERVVDGYGTKHAISMRDGRLEVRLGAGDWYRVAPFKFGSDPMKTAAAVAKLNTTWPDRI